MSNLAIIDPAVMQVMSKKVAQSGMFGVKNENQVYSLMLIAESENLHPMKALQQFHIINGKPALKSAEVLSRFQLAGGKIKYLVSNDEVCEVEFTHEQAGSLTIKWTIEKAKSAGIYSTNPVWKKYPSNMLRARCITDGVTAIYPACLGGNMTETTAQDIPYTEPEIIETVEDIEVVETKSNVDYNKKLLADKLRKANYNQAMMKAFFDLYITSDEILEQVVNDDKLFNELLDKYDS